MKKLDFISGMKKLSSFYLKEFTNELNKAKKELEMNNYDFGMKYLRRYRKIYLIKLLKRSPKRINICLMQVSYMISVLP